jgi:hypothetical protein
MNQEHDLERDLQRALRRVSPPPGFAERLRQRIERGAAPPGRARWRAAAAAVTFALVLGGYATHRFAEHRRGVEAKERVLTAMRIFNEKVRLAQQEIREIGGEQ